MSAKEKGREGLMLLEQAVMDVLFHARHSGYIQLKAVREFLDLPEVESPDGARTDALIYGILCRLLNEDRVLYAAGDGWRITSKGQGFQFPEDIDEHSTHRTNT